MSTSERNQKFYQRDYVKEGYNSSLLRYLLSVWSLTLAKNLVKLDNGGVLEGRIMVR